MTHRPLEKVEKNKKFMVAILVFNVISFLIFVGYYSTFFFTNDEKCLGKKLSIWSFFIEFNALFELLGIVAIICFLFSAVFYILSACLNPGFVRP